MFDRVYRQRLEADLARWETDGVITPAARLAISGALPPLSAGANVGAVVGVVGGLLIAAAFLAFVAAHWTDLPRLLRLAVLVAGIVGTHGIGAWFARAGRPILADLCASVGAIIFGAGIALVGQMYHMSGDFAAGILLWAAGALVSAALTGSRGALAVALVAGSTWSGMRVADLHDVPHLPFVLFWLIAAGLALAWKSRAAAHLVALATLPWWIMAAAWTGSEVHYQPFLVVANGAALLFGVGLALAAAPWQRMRDAGAVLSIYGALSLAVVAALVMLMTEDSFLFLRMKEAAAYPLWIISCGIAGVLLAFVAAAMKRQSSAIFAGIAVALVVAAAAAWIPGQFVHPQRAYIAGLAAMLCLIISGTLDAARPRIVAGWLGMAGVIALITWTMKSSLLYRSAFLAAAGAVAIVLAIAFNRLLPRTDE